MGSKSKSKSSQSTTNYSTTFGIQGANHGQVINGNGNSITDGGAFEIVGDIANMLPSLFKDALFTADNLGTSAINAGIDLAGMGARQNEHFLNESVSFLGDVAADQHHLYKTAMDGVTEFGQISAEQTEHFVNATSDNYQAGLDANQEILTTALDGNFALSETVANALENANNNNTDLASRFGAQNAALADASMANSALLAGESMRNNADLLDSFGGYLADANNNNSDLAKFSVASGNDLAERLTSNVLAADARNDQQSLDILQRNTDSILNFAETYSRSDGVALANNNNKTMLITLGGVALLGVAIIMAGRKS